VQVVRAQAGAARERLQAGRLLRLLDQPAQLGDQRRVRAFLSRTIRPATLARPEAGTLGVLCRGMKLDVLRPRGARCA
jgi:hypothetical protein